MRYIALVHKDPDSVYGVQFPDVPGCFSAGDTLDMAVANGTEALAYHVDLLEIYGDPIQPPRPLDEIVADPELADTLEDATLIAIPLVAVPSRNLGATTRINVSLDMGLLKAIDTEARARGQTRSAFIASAVRRELVE